jgi:hypothetical protein
MDLTGTLMDLQQQMMQGQLEQMALVKKITELEETLRLTQARANLLDQYELLSVGPGKVAYALKQEFKGTQPAHLCCNNCYDNGKRSLFEGQKPYKGWMNFLCSACKYCLSIELTYVPKELLVG